MWSSSRVRIAAVVLLLATGAMLSACSGPTPVYGPGGVTQEQVALLYAKPSNRVEQVIYEDLALKLGKASGNAPTLALNVTTLSRDLTSAQSTTDFPSVQKQEEVTAAIRLTDVNGTVLFSGMRSATADYTTNSQGLASDRAQSDATIRAAHALAETIRLTLLGALGK